MKLYIFFLLLGSISAVWAQSCSTNSCLRQVRATGSPAAARSTRRRDCSSFLRTTVTPVPRTVSRTRTLTAPTRTIVSTRSTTVTRTVATATSTRLSTSTVRTTSTARTTRTTTVTVTVTASSRLGKRTDVPEPEREKLWERLVEGISHDERNIQLQGEDAHPLAKRQANVRPVTVTPTRRPSYATSCPNSSRYASACSCLGVSRTTTTVATPTLTTTINRTITPSTTRTTTRTSTLSRTASTTISRTITTTVRATTTLTIVATVTATVIVEPPPPPEARCKAADGKEALEGSQGCKCCWDVQPVTHLLARQHWMEFYVFDLDMCVQLCDNYRGRCKGVELYGNDDEDMLTCRLYQGMNGPEVGGALTWDTMVRVSISEGSCQTCEDWQPPVSTTTSTSAASTSTTMSTSEASSVDPTPTPSLPPSTGQCQANANSLGVQGEAACGCCWDVQESHKLLLHYDDHIWVSSLEECIQLVDNSRGFYKAFEFFTLETVHKDIGCRLHRVADKPSHSVSFPVKMGTMGRGTCQTCEAVPRPWDTEEECNRSGALVPIIKGFYEGGCHCCWDILDTKEMLAREPDEIMDVSASPYRCIQECDKRDWCIRSEALSSDGGWEFQCRMFSSTDGPLSMTGDPRTVVLRGTIPNRSSCDNCPASGPVPGSTSTSTSTSSVATGPVATPAPTPGSPGQCQSDGSNQVIKGTGDCDCCYKIEDTRTMLQNAEQEVDMKAGDLDRCAELVDASNGRFKAFEFLPTEGDDYSCRLHEYKNKRSFNAWTDIKYGSMVQGSCTECEGGPEPECRPSLGFNWGESIKGQAGCGCCWDILAWQRLMVSYDTLVSVSNLEECIQLVDTSQGYYKQFEFYSPPDAPNTFACRLHRSTEGNGAYDVLIDVKLGRAGYGSCTACQTAPEPPTLGKDCTSRWGAIIKGDEGGCGCCWNLAEGSTGLIDRTPALVVDITAPLQCTQECDSRDWCFVWEAHSEDGGWTFKCRLHETYTTANIVGTGNPLTVAIRGWVDDMAQCDRCHTRPPFTPDAPISTSTVSTSTSSASATESVSSSATPTTPVPDTCELRDGFDTFKIEDPKDNECGCCWDLQEVSGWLEASARAGGDSIGKEYCARDCERNKSWCRGYEVQGEDLDNSNSYSECRMYGSMDHTTGPRPNWGGKILRGTVRAGSCGSCGPLGAGSSSTSTSTTSTATTTSTTTTPTASNTFTPGDRDPNNQCSNPGPSEIITGWAGCDCCWDVKPETSVFVREPDWTTQSAPDRWWCIHHCDSFMGECKAVESFSNDGGQSWGCRLFRENSGARRAITSDAHKAYRATIIKDSCSRCDPDAAGGGSTPIPTPEPEPESTPGPIFQPPPKEQCPPIPGHETYDASCDCCFQVEKIYRVWGTEQDVELRTGSVRECVKKCDEQAGCVAFDAIKQEGDDFFICSLHDKTTGGEMTFGDSRLVNWRGTFTPGTCREGCK